MIPVGELEMRTFAYCRVSTTEQETSNQILAIRNAGYEVSESRVVSETISGSVAAFERPEFLNLVTNRMEAGDKLIVLKLDRLGRSNIDVQLTIQRLQEMGIKIVCLDLPIQDLSSPEGALMLQIFVSFAEFERNKIKERTKQGLDRAVSEGKTLGRPKPVERIKKIQALKSEQFSQSQVAERLGVSIATVKRHWNVP